MYDRITFLQGGNSMRCRMENFRVMRTGLLKLSCVWPCVVAKKRMDQRNLDN